MSELKKLTDVYDESAKVQVQTAQVKMLIELIKLSSEEDVKTALKKYIDNKEKELGI